MSYILDALKRADAERERGHVPGLRSQSGSTTAATPVRDTWVHRTGPLLWLGGLAGVVLIAGAAFWWWSAGRSAPGLAAPSVQAPAAAPAAATPQVRAPEAPPATPSLPILAPPPPPAPAPVASTTAPPGPPASPGADGSAKVRSLNELPPETRAQLPQVGISGGTYSSNREHRMLIANGKVVHEGEEIAPGLTLESIGPGKAVLNHLGTRYSVGY
jgi:general secretion pathway protein B